MTQDSQKNRERDEARLKDFREKIAKLSYVPKRGWFQIAGDFQCDQTGGFPTNLVVNWAKGKAWLELDRSKAKAGQDLSPYELGCVEWGIRKCRTLQDYTSLTMSLGKAVAHAIELDEEIYEEMMMEW